jgi:hypothetical protein
MSYTKASPQPSGLASGETAVTLDTGETIAVAISLTPQPNNAPSFVAATARQINPDGTAMLDTAGQPIGTEFRYTPTPDEANDPTSLAAAQKDCLMAVLGEPLTGPLNDPIHANAIANCSIRNRIAALAIAGPVDAGALL